ncbi:hypothetical protein [Micromonospora sp. WMMD1274]|uniref:hypothetical protein n=1 Tax=Micromonospora sp. WMMD1274 TaxID=3404116 RepID=UPI003B96452A
MSPAATAADVTRQHVAPVAKASPDNIADANRDALAGSFTPSHARPQVVTTVRDSGRVGDWRAATMSPAEVDVSPSPAVAHVAAASSPRQSSADAIRAAAAEQGATPARAAAALGLSVRTCQRHWPRAAVVSAA